MAMPDLHTKCRWLPLLFDFSKACIKLKAAGPRGRGFSDLCRWLWESNMGSWPTNVKISHENLAKIWDITSLDIVQKKNKNDPKKWRGVENGSFSSMIYLQMGFSRAKLANGKSS